MERERILLHINVDLDPVAGAFSTIQSARDAIQGFLVQSIAHYHPFVSIPEQTSPYRDTALFITPEHVAPGGPFFMHEEASVGYYVIRSNEPVKRDLFLPPYIFRKCFRFVDENVGLYPDVFQTVVELS